MIMIRFYGDQSRVIYRSPLDRSQLIYDVARHLAEAGLSNTLPVNILIILLKS